jgi:hypothetical protein
LQKDTLIAKLSALGYTIGIDTDTFYKNYCIAVEDYNEWLLTVMSSTSIQRIYRPEALIVSHNDKDCVSLFTMSTVVDTFPFERSCVYRGIINWALKKDDILRACGLPATWQEVSLGLMDKWAGIQPAKQVTRTLNCWPASFLEEWIDDTVDNFYISVDQWSETLLSRQARIFSITIMCVVNDISTFKDDYSSNMLAVKLTM